MAVLDGAPQQALDYSARHAEEALVVVSPGNIVVERYAPGFAAAKPHALYSGTKSFWGALAVAAQDDGLLRLDEPVADTVPDWRRDAQKARVTLRELLNLTSGFGFGGLGASVPSYEKALAMPLRDEPGTKFTYGGVPLMVFGAVLARKLAPRGITPHDYLRERILDRIGVRVASWRTLSDGTQPLPTGAFLTALEWLRYGRFLLSGAAGGETVVRPEALGTCFVGSGPNERYGLGFWLHRTKSGTDVIYASGSGGQALYVIPQLETVVVRFAGGGSYKHEAFLSRFAG
jgi:CubicO group peptidase (beta-lactamase class C family)